GKQKLDRCGIEADSMVQRENLVLFIYATNDHHAGKNLKLIDMPRIACKERLYCEGFVCLYDDIYPRARNIDACELINDAVDLNDDDGIVKGSGFHNHRSIFCIRACEQIALGICLFCAHQGNVGSKIDKKARVELDIGVNRS